MADKKEMTKEQQQNILFGILLSIGFTYCITVFGFSPLGEKYAVVNKEIEDYKSKVLVANGYKKAKTKKNDILAINKAELNEALSKMPPREYPMVWSSALIRRLWQEVEIPSNMRTTKSLNRIVKSTKKKSSKTKATMFTQYTVEVSLICDYHKVGKFVAALEREIPFAFISNIVMSKSMGFKGKLETVLTCVFPRLSETGELMVKEGMSL